MDLGMSPVVLLLAVLTFVVSADELVLQLNGELGSFPESMILTKIQMGVIDPTPIVNERGLRYFVQIARNNVVVYPRGIQTIVPHNRKRYDSQRLVPITGNRLRCTSCGSSYQTPTRTTLPPSAFSSKSKTVRPKSANPGEPVKTPGPEGRPQSSSVEPVQLPGTSQSLKSLSNNQSRQAASGGASKSSASSGVATRDQQSQRTLVDVLKPGKGRELSVVSRPMNLPDRMMQAANEQVQSGAEAIDVLRSLVNSMDAQNPVLFPERYYQRSQNTQQIQPIQSRQSQDQYYQVKNRFQSSQELPHQQSQDLLRQQSQSQRQQQSQQDFLHQQPQDLLHQESQSQRQQQSHQDLLHQLSQDLPHQQSQGQLHRNLQDLVHHQSQSQLQLQLSQDQLQQQPQERLQVAQVQPLQESQAQFHQLSPNQANPELVAANMPQGKRDIQPQHQTATVAATYSTTAQNVTHTTSTPTTTTSETTRPITHTDSSNGLISTD